MLNFNRSIKTKLFVLLIIVGALPFVIVASAVALRMIDDLETAAANDAMLRNTIVSDHVTDLFEKNFYVLHTLSRNPTIVQCMKSPTNNPELVLKLLKDTNAIFRDSNHIALTGADGQQLFRTDTGALISIENRRYFKESMTGKDYVSDMIVSRSTQKMIVPLAVPIKDERSETIGILQRNFDLAELQKFVEKQAGEQSYVIIIDRTGRMIVNSAKAIDPLADNMRDDSYSRVLKRMSQNSGITQMMIEGRKTLIGYSRNALTDWTIVAAQPYHYIMGAVFELLLRLLLIGSIILILIFAGAYYLAWEATKPIIAITEAAVKVVNGSSIEELDISSRDELGKMAEAFNKMRSARDAFQQDAELDQLTQLYNKATMERLCRRKLEQFDEEDGMTVLYIIDLDHFKEVNDTLGHQFGDKVLKAFAKRLQKCFHEFVVIIEGMPSMDVIVRKAELIRKMAAELAIEGKITGVTSSIGIAIAPQHGRDYEELFRSADEALYYVKKHGRNNYHIEQNMADF